MMCGGKRRVISKPRVKVSSNILFMLEELGFDAQVEATKEEDNASSKPSDKETL